MRYFKLFCITSLILIAIFLTVFAEVPQVINYQGRLLDSEENPVNESKLMKFIIYDAPTGETILWNSLFQTVGVVNGLFHIQLGTPPMDQLPDDLFSADTVRYLGITVGTDDEMIPRTRLTTGIYAYQALRSDSALTAEYANDADLLDGMNSDEFAMASHSHIITTVEIQNGTILLEDLSDNSAGLGQIIKWNGTSWEIADDEDNGAAIPITTEDIQNGTILLEDLNGNLAAFNQIMKWNGTNWEVADDEDNGAAIPTTPFTGSTLLSSDDQQKLNEWIGNPFLKWKLCYKMSNDGPSSTPFHSQCDNRGPSVTIIYANGYLFGGYIDISWAKAGSAPSEEAFLFSLTADKVFPISGAFSNFAMYGSASYGPYFGHGPDIIVQYPNVRCYFPFAYSWEGNAGAMLAAATMELYGTSPGTSVPITEMEVFILDRPYE